MIHASCKREIWICFLFATLFLIAAPFIFANEWGPNRESVITSASVSIGLGALLVVLGVLKISDVWRGPPIYVHHLKDGCYEVLWHKNHWGRVWLLLMDSQTAHRHDVEPILVDLLNKPYEGGDYLYVSRHSGSLQLSEASQIAA